MWTGKCQVMHEPGKSCKIQLVNEDETIFAQTILTDGKTYDTHIQRAYDSTRAYSLMLTSDTGQKAMVGIMFPERNDSFDFIQALDEFKKAWRIENGLDKEFQKPDSAKIAEDLSLKEGEKITVNIPGVTTGAENKPKKSGFGGGLKKLAPPPGFKGKPKADKQPLLETNNLLDAPADQYKPADGGLSDLLGGGQVNALNPAPKKEDAFDELFNNLDGQPEQKAIAQGSLLDL